MPSRPVVVRERRSMDHASRGRETESSHNLSEH
jgi:hypothetical protein